MLKTLVLSGNKIYPAGQEMPTQVQVFCPDTHANPPATKMHS